MNRHVWQCLQRCFQRLHQTRIAHVGDIGHVDRPGKTTTEHRHRIMRRRDIHSPQRAVFPLGPGQRFGFVIQIQPIQAGGVHLWIDPGVSKQALAELWIKILGPMRQRGDCRAVAPWIQRRNDTATRPGRFLANVRTIEQHNAAALRRRDCRRSAGQLPRHRQSPLAVAWSCLIQPIKRQWTQKAPERTSAAPAILGGQPGRRVVHAAHTGVGQGEIPALVRGHGCRSCGHRRQQEGLVGRGSG
jgi:hypothetical protein